MLICLDPLTGPDLDARPSAADLLTLPFFAEYHDEAQEPVSARFEMAFEAKRRTAEWKTMLFAELQDYAATHEPK